LDGSRLGVAGWLGPLGRFCTFRYFSPARRHCDPPREPNQSGHGRIARQPVVPKATTAKKGGYCRAIQRLIEDGHIQMRLKRFNIKVLLIDDYSEITEFLTELVNQYRRRTVFVSTSASAACKERSDRGTQSLF